MGWASFAAGVVAGNPGLMGASLLAMSKKQWYSAFQSIRKVINYQRKGVMKLICGNLTRNLIYTQPADFEFVKQFIVAHCREDVKVVSK